MAVPGDEETEGGMDWLTDVGIGMDCPPICIGSELETAIANVGPVAGGRDMAVRPGLVD